MNNDEKAAGRPTYEELLARCDRLAEERNQRLQAVMKISEAKQQTDEELNRIKAIQHFVQQALDLHTVDDLIEISLEAVIEAFECETALFLEYDEPSQNFKVIKQFGEEAEYQELAGSPDLFKSKETILISEGDPLLAQWAPLNFFNAIVSTFPRNDSPLRGAIIAGTTEEGVNVYNLFDENHISSFFVLVSQVGALWNNLYLYQETVDYAKLTEEHHKQLEEQHEQLEQAHRDLKVTNLAYSRFVPDDFLRYLDRGSIVDVQLGDNIETSMSILFSDIRQFTTITEKLSPEETFVFLNSFLKQMGPVIRKHNGFIDKYIGDAIMALFPEKPDDAVLAAIDMRKELIDFNDDRIKNNKEPIDIGTGIHTGKLMLGTIGEEKRMEGTVISDAVNQASRVEGLSKIFGASIVISESTLNNIKDKETLHYRFIGKIKVKGKDESIPVYDLFEGNSKTVKELKASTRKDFETGLSLYHSKNFTEASVYFNKVKDSDPHDKAAMIYLKRSAQLMIQGVPEHWDGTEEMDSK